MTPLQVSFLDIQNEFGGGGETSLSEYYRGGAYVPAWTPAGASGVQIPTGGTISMSEFRYVSKTYLAGSTTFSATGTGELLFGFASNGRVNCASVPSAGGYWMLPAVANVGTPFFVRVVRINGHNLTHGTEGQWYQLNVDRTFGYVQGVMQRQGTYRADIAYGFASDSSIVSQHTLSMLTNYTPPDPGGGGV